MSDEPQARGSIYDLGYRRYEGVRLGRSSALLALYTHSLRSCFGLGRRTTSKIIPIGLTILVFIPAAIQLGIAAILDDSVEVIRASSYFGWVQSILALFAAAIAPEIVGRDQRNRTLALYFSRALTRTDYALAKLGAFVTAMLILTLLPQMLLFIGNGMAGNDLNGYFADEISQVPAIVSSAVMISVVVALVSLPIAAQTPRRAYATGTILGTFMITWILGGVLSAVFGEDTGNPSLFFAPIWFLRGFSYWVFEEPPSSDNPIAMSGYDGLLYLGACIAWIIIGGYFFHRRIAKVAA